MANGGKKITPILEDGSANGFTLTNESKGGNRVTLVDDAGEPILLSGDGGNVSSVNGQTGDVVLEANDLNAYTKNEVDSINSAQDSLINANTNAIVELNQPKMQINANITTDTLFTATYTPLTYDSAQLVDDNGSISAGAVGTGEIIINELGKYMFNIYTLFIKTGFGQVGVADIQLQTDKLDGNGFLEVPFGTRLISVSEQSGQDVQSYDLSKIIKNEVVGQKWRLVGRELDSGNITLNELTTSVTEYSN